MKKVVFSVGLALTFWLVSLPVAMAHDHSEHLKAVNQSRLKGSEIPGAINLGLAGKSGSHVATHLQEKLEKQLQGYQHVHPFGHEPHGDAKLLAAAAEEGAVSPGPRCPKDAPVRSYGISAINVTITVNQYHDFFPGYMYTLTENVAKVREEEARNEAARGEEYGPHDPGAVTNGLSGGLIQPLAIRVNQSECLVINLKNEVEDEKVSLHLHGSSLLVRATGAPATSKNPDAYAKPGETKSFEWYVPLDQQEGAHQFHSHIRNQASTGLFGVVTVEPRGSRFLDPYTGKELKSGWLAMIEDPNGPDFREFVIVYHEVGHEEFRPLNKKEEMIPLRDQAADDYRPGTRAINYRSESFANNLELQKKLFGRMDESLSYSAYLFGDPATPIPRSYVGDPVKWRVVHGGSEVFHSHHLHGGAIRWQRQPKLTQDLNLFTLASSGPVKSPPVRTASDRVDVQTIGPTESHDFEIECGSGGCQHTAGDFLYHCHIPHHYVAGMWSFWRVYNTLQVEGARTDVMLALQELPDRKARMKPAADSTELVDKTVHWFGKNFKIEANGGDRKAGVYSIEDWVAMQLPPQGKPGKTDDEKEQILAYDASVWDWAKQKTSGGKILYLGEPETTVQWPKYQPERMGSKPGERYKLLFDPVTGKLAWPHMRPHFGKRPPFSPDHNGAPFLEPIHENGDGTRSASVPHPGENGPWSLCPQESNDPSRIKHYNVHAITLPITLSKAKGDLPPIVDENGQIFVLHEEEERIRANDDLKIPLIIRANVSDCVDVVFSSELPDHNENLSSSKVNMHIHFVQFDVQASDGVITGMAYEQSVRPFTLLEDDEEGLGKPQNELIATEAKAGATRISLRSAASFHPGTLVGIGMDEVGRLEIRRIKAIEGNDLVLEEPLAHPHKAGEIVSVEFMRYRWYADADTGITYWHDHAFGLTSWGHGLFGALVVEPKGSTYHDPRTGELVRSGSIVDIHTSEPVSSQVQGNFREFVFQIQDSNPRTENRILSGTVPEKRPEGVTAPSPINKLGSMDSWSLMPTAFKYLNGGDRTSGSSFGLRVEPLNRRLAVNPDPSVLFSSRVHGDPDTPLLHAYLGDPIVIRALDQAGNEMHAIHVDGHSFPLERYAAKAQPRNTVHLGIAERYDLAIPAAGGPQQMAGDYLYRSGLISHFGEGMWGTIRVLDKPVPDLQPLGRKEIPRSTEQVCPPGAPVKTFNVSAIDLPMDLNPLAPALIEVGGTNRNIIAENPQGKRFVLDEELQAVKAGTKEPHPLVLRASVGECIKVNLHNRLKEGQVSFHADMLAYDPNDSMGINVGQNREDQTVAPGKTRTYTFYAHPEFGETAALVTAWGDVSTHVRDGLYGAIITGPRGSKYYDPVTREDISLKNSWRADVVVNTSIPENQGRRNYRDVALFFQDEDNVIGTPFMPYVRDSAGLASVNYRTEPFLWRTEKYDCEFEDGYSCNGADDPVTPTIEAHAGDSLRLHVFGAHSVQNAVFSVEGHQWPLEPEMEGAELLEAEQFGGTGVLELNLKAGSPFALPGDYVWMNHRLAYAEAGQWGILRVLPPTDARIASLDSYRAANVMVAEQKNGEEEKPVLHQVSPR